MSDIDSSQPASWGLVTLHPPQDSYKLIMPPTHPQYVKVNISDIEDMPALLRRLRRRISTRFNRAHLYPTSQVQQGVDSPTPDTSPQDDRYSIDTYYTKSSSGRTTPEPLPVLTDRGPPGRNRYANEDIFWNSVMLEADHDPARISYLSEKPLEMPGFYNIGAAVNLDANAANLPEPSGTVREEVRKDPSPPRPLVRRHTDRPISGMRDGAISRHKLRRNRTEDDLMFTMGRSVDIDSISPVRAHFRSRIPAAFDGTIDDDLDQAYDPPMRRVHFASHASAQRDTEDEGTAHGDDALTWNSVLNRILSNDAVDQVMRERVYERVNTSSLTNGIGHGEQGEHQVTARTAGLVPNFSRPLQGSGFYSMTDVEPQIRSNETHLPNHIGHDDEQPESNLTNGFRHSNSPTSSIVSNNTLHRFPSPPPDIPAELKELLTTSLTPSEFALYSRLIGRPFPDRNASPSSANTPASSPINPIVARLVHSLHTVLLGLQDRMTSLEEDLVPRMSGYLEDQSKKIKALQEEVAFQDEQITELKRCSDYTNKILRGCWSREWELWRTLIDIRRYSLANVGLVKRLLFRRVGRQITRLGVEERDVYSSIPTGHRYRENDGRGPFPSWYDAERTMTGRRGIGEKELDALTVMAKQNVDILKADFDEAADMMRELRYHVRKARERDVERERERENEKEAGVSWRDV
ncbi:hypothetical protein NX059_003830 [Plenodomus lindquistii]|nr:hypothetical protein NX059_003830 [Plenodomus lindquistii]